MRLTTLLPTTLISEICCRDAFGSNYHDVAERDIVGHDSEVVSRGYTHLDSDDTADSMSKLPDITRPTCPPAEHP